MGPSVPIGCPDELFRTMINADFTQLGKIFTEVDSPCGSRGHGGMRFLG